MSRSKDPPRVVSNPKFNCFSCQWRERSEWCVLKSDDIQFLDEKKSTRSFRNGEFVFYQGDDCLGVYTVVSGVLAIRKTDSEGHSALVRLRHPGETIGYRDFFSGGVFTTSAQALSEGSLCFIEKSAVQQLLERNPSLGLGFLHQLAVDLQGAEDTILQTVAMPMRTRMAHLLLTLKDRFAEVDDQGALSMKLPLSRQDIADVLGARPETVARIIHALEDDGVAFFSGRKVVIPDLDPLLDEIEHSGAD